MMQPGQSAHRQAHLADQAARQAQLQVRLGYQQAQQRRYRRRQQQAQHPAPFGLRSRAGSSLPAQGRQNTRGKDLWVGHCRAAVFWAIAIVTHVEWVRLHDGPVTPVSYSLAVVVSVLVAGLPLALSGLSRHRPQGNAADWDRAGALEHDEAACAGVGSAGGAPVPGLGRESAHAAGAADLRPVASDATVHDAGLGAWEAAGDGWPVLLVASSTGGRPRIPIPPGGLVLGRSNQLGEPFLGDELVSRQHASVGWCTDGSVEVADLGSTNGTYLNARKLAAPARMQAGDVLRIGHVEMRLDPARTRSRPHTGRARAALAILMPIGPRSSRPCAASCPTTRPTPAPRWP